jgi:N-acetylglucosamine-6-phosphate deacetylase
MVADLAVLTEELAVTATVISGQVYDWRAVRT